MAKAEKVGGKDTVKDTVKDTLKLLSDSEKRILEEISKNPKINAEKLSEFIGINLRNTKKNIAKLKEKKLLKRAGPAKGGHWEVVKDGR